MEYQKQQSCRRWNTKSKQAFRDEKEIANDVAGCDFLYSGLYYDKMSKVTIVPARIGILRMTVIEQSEMIKYNIFMLNDPKEIFKLNMHG